MLCAANFVFVDPNGPQREQHWQPGRRSAPGDLRTDTPVSLAVFAQSIATCRYFDDLWSSSGDQVRMINLGDDVSDTDAFRMVRSLPSQTHCRTLPRGVIRPILLNAQANVCRCAGRV